MTGAELYTRFAKLRRRLVIFTAIVIGFAFIAINQNPAIHILRVLGQDQTPLEDYMALEKKLRELPEGPNAALANMLFRRQELLSEIDGQLVKANLLHPNTQTFNFDQGLAGAVGEAILGDDVESQACGRNIGCAINRADSGGTINQPDEGATINRGGDVALGPETPFASTDNTSEFEASDNTSSNKALSILLFRMEQDERELAKEVRRLAEEVRRKEIMTILSQPDIQVDAVLLDELKTLNATIEKHLEETYQIREKLDSYVLTYKILIQCLAGVLMVTIVEVWSLWRPVKLYILNNDQPTVEFRSGIWAGERAVFTITVAFVAGIIIWPYLLKFRPDILNSRFIYHDFILIEYFLLVVGVYFLGSWIFLAGQKALRHNRR